MLARVAVTLPSEDAERQPAVQKYDWYGLYRFGPKCRHKGEGGKLVLMDNGAERD